MGMLDELNDLLDRIPMWKRLTGLPIELEELKQRVAKLEAKLSAPRGAVCPMCSEPTLVMTGIDQGKSKPQIGLYIDRMQCSSCGHQETRTRTT